MKSTWLCLFRRTDVTGKIESFRADDDCATQTVMPGHGVKTEVELIQPIAIEKGMRFVIRDGGCTVGAVLEIKA